MKRQYLGIKPRHSRGHDPDQFARRMVEHMNRSGLTAKLIKPLNEDETHGFEVRGARDTAHLADAYFDAIDAIHRGEAKIAGAERTILRKNGALHSRLGKTAGVRLNEVASAIKDVVTRFPTIDHLKAYSRHAALNAGLVSHHLKRRELGDAAHAAAFTVLPPSHHTSEDMKSMMGVSHKDWYRWGNHTGPDPIKTAASGADHRKGESEMTNTPPTRQEIEHMLRKSLRYQRLRAGLGGGLTSALLSGGLTAGMNADHPDQWTTAAQMAGLGAAVGGGSGYFGTKGEQRATNYRVRNDATGEVHRFPGNKLASDRSDMLSWVESRLLKQAMRRG